MSNSTFANESPVRFASGSTPDGLVSSARLLMTKMLEHSRPISRVRLSASTSTTPANQSVDVLIGSTDDYLHFDRDDDGSVIVSDPYGVAVGKGNTVGDALADWREQAHEQLASLRSAGSLHERMERQLRFLERFL